MTRHPIIPSDELPYDDAIDRSARWLDDALRAIRAASRQLTRNSLAPAVAGRLLMALEFGSSDIDRPCRPPGHAVPAPTVTVEDTGLVVSWMLGSRRLRLRVEGDGATCWTYGADGPHTTCVHLAGQRGAIGTGRDAMGWLLEREEIR